MYKEFVESFEHGSKGINKTWIKGGIANPDKGEDKVTGSKIYKPVSKLLERKPLLDSKPKEMEKPSLLKKKSAVSLEKKKTNLELFKEELKVIQEERQERRKVRQDLGLIPSDPVSSKGKNRFDEEPIAAGISMGILPTAEEIRMGSFTYENDTQTTNLYLGNINPKMTEMQICEIFGKYGPLASVKIMWPRTEEEKARGRNCGFVAFMNRKDGERALANLQGKDVMDFEMKLGWGKAVPIPPHPIYIPPALSELTLPPPPSGQPFNAQLIKPSQNGESSSDNDLSNYVVKVVIPTEKTLLSVIHRMIEFVVREGPMFEAMIMNRELQNPLFRFLFENQSPAHVYYRWKLYSILQGDSPFSWRTDEFYMFKGGSLWRPPQMNPFSHGMPEELVVDSNQKSQAQVTPEETIKKCTLTDSQRDKLENLLRDLTPERSKIADCMVWCLDHAENAEEVVECIAESLSIIETPMPKKIARLFLVSDLLHNSSARIPHASFFRRNFEGKLQEVFKNLHDAHEKIDARLKAEQFKHKVMSCFRAWEDWAVYPNDFLINLQNIFLGLVLPKGNKMNLFQDEDDDNNDVDGIPLEELDGVPLENKMQAEDSGSDTSDFVKSIVPYGDEDEASMTKVCKPTFVPSKWETVDESELESQAMTVSKWELLDQKKAESSKENDVFDEDEIDGRPVDEEMDVKHDYSGGCDLSKHSKNIFPEHAEEGASSRIDDASKSQQEINESKRAKLREIELKVMKFQDDLESNKTRKSNSSVTEQVNEYRQKLLREMELYDEDWVEKSEKDMSSHDASDKKKESDSKTRKSRDDGKESKNDKHVKVY